MERGSLREAVSKVNNAVADTVDARSRLERTLAAERRARAGMAGHPDAPTVVGDAIAVNLPMDRPGRGHWTFIVKPGGIVEKVPHVRQEEPKLVHGLESMNAGGLWRGWN